MPTACRLRAATGKARAAEPAPSRAGAAAAANWRSGSYTKSMRVALLLLLVIAQGCATAGKQPQSYYFLSQPQWEAELQRRGVSPEEVPNPLLVTDSMRDMARDFAGPGNPTERLNRLRHALFSETMFPFTYESRNTFTAAEAFHRREGNCLSFTNLFVALGRSLGIPVTTALVRRRGLSEREGDLIVVNNHVVAILRWEAEPVFYDFDRERQDLVAAAQAIDDLGITSLYLNNRGADELRAGHPEIALKFFLYAVRLSPEFAPAWGNVGVARRRVGDFDGALDAYRQALLLEPGNPTILNNLGALYRSIGRYREAEAAAAAANLSQASPHVLIVRGDLELARGKTEEALKLYKRARRLGPKLADPLVALARLELVKSNPSKARSYAEKALKLEPKHREARELLARLGSSAQAHRTVLGSTQ